MGMCNLYAQTRNVAAIRRLFRVPHNRAASIDPQTSIFPGYTAPVIRKAEDGERELVHMTWGFVLLQDGRAPRRVTNVRDDKILSRFWRPSFERRRCLVPASSYCEPDSGKPAKWHWFAVNGDEDRRLFAFAGIWRRWIGPVKKDGVDVELDVYSFMTTAPNCPDGFDQSRTDAGAAVRGSRVRNLAFRDAGRGFCASAELRSWCDAHSSERV